jgi:alginate O-acetyltransferase complex protein AlgI
LWQPCRNPPRSDPARRNGRAPVIFASFEFLFLFLPIFFVAYYLTPARLRNWPVLILSWAFYAWWRVDFLALLICVTLFTYFTSRMMVAAGLGGRVGKIWLQAGLFGNLGVLAYFKYANFGVDTLNGVLAVGDSDPLTWARIVLPAGLSFYVLQSISYLVDVWRGTIPVSRSLLNYAAYKAMFSQLIAGPIVRYAQIADELRSRVHSMALFGRGARRFMIGFCMKVIVADTLSPLVDAIYRLPAPSLADGWLGAVGYTLQLYFDFAGYSAMTIGLALMIGFHFPENFDLPYLSGSIQAFWQRWHMTLSSFLRDYLYISLGGNRQGAVRTYVNLVLTMLIGGLWHGANWTFVAWGAWHGGLLAIHRFYRSRGGRMPVVAGHVLTMLAVILGWVVFRADSFGEALRLYQGMAWLRGTGVSDDLAWQLTPDRFWMVFIGIAVVYAPLVEARVAAAFGRAGAGLSLIGPFCGFVVAMVLLYSRAAVPFLYFQF